MAKTAELQEAPGAETAEARGRRSKRRLSHFPDGKDVVLMAVQRDEQGQPIPNGALTMVPDLPRFHSSQEAERWMRAHGEDLAGFKMICVKFCWAAMVAVEQKPLISVNMSDRHEQSRSNGTKEGSGG